MNWDERFITNNTEIDAQHHNLIDILNKLHEAMRVGKGSVALTTIFDELIAYTDYHFKTEEKLFATVTYPEVQDHIKQHRALVAQALDLQAKFKAGTDFITVEVLSFLKNWVNDHILKMDMTYKGII